LAVNDQGAARYLELQRGYCRGDPGTNFGPAKDSEREARSNSNFPSQVIGISPIKVESVDEREVV
jgi:hypothetical protein